MDRLEGKVKKIYGYARVSTKEQNLDRQIMSLIAFGIDDLALKRVLSIILQD